MNDTSMTPRRHPLVVVLAIILAAQAALVAVLTVTMLIEILRNDSASVGSGVALVVLGVIATGWLVVVASNVLRGRAWTRSATVVSQVLQLAVAVGAFQGAFARPDVGWLLLIPAVVALGILFTRPVVAFTARREGD